MVDQGLWDRAGVSSRKQEVLEERVHQLEVLTQQMEAHYTELIGTLRQRVLRLERRVQPWRPLSTKRSAFRA